MFIVIVAIVFVEFPDPKKDIEDIDVDQIEENKDFEKQLN